MKPYLYELLNSPKLKCPNCGKKEFNGLVYYGTKDYVDPEKYGRCDRIMGCGYDVRPTREKKDYTPPTIRKFPQTKKRYYMEEKVLTELQKNGFKDAFSVSMFSRFDKKKKKKPGWRCLQK